MKKKGRGKKYEKKNTGKKSRGKKSRGKKYGGKKYGKKGGIPGCACAHPWGHVTIGSSTAQLHRKCDLNCAHILLIDSTLKNDIAILQRKVNTIILQTRVTDLCI